MIEFQAWPKTPRLFRDMIVTEKIDGTNAAVIIEKVESDYNIALELTPPGATAVITDGAGAPDFEGSTLYFVGAQSRKRLITPSDDNFGFARWVHDNAETLVDVLGPGRHFGEWWGSGIQRGYGLPKGEKRFSLFNVSRYMPLLTAGSSDLDPDDLDFGLRTVPVIHEGPFDLNWVKLSLGLLESEGSKAAPGFMRPEGVIVYHSALNGVFKATIEDDEKPKGADQ